MHRTPSKASQDDHSSPESFASLAVVACAQLPPGYQALISLSLLQDTSSPAKPHPSLRSNACRLLGSLTHKSLQRSECNNDCKSVEALAVWDITVQAAPSSKSQEQGSPNQPTQSAQLQLVGCYDLTSPAGRACQVVHVMKCTQGCAQLVMADDSGKPHVRCLDWSSKSLKLSTVGTLPSSGSLASGKGLLLLCKLCLLFGCPHMRC